MKLKIIWPGRTQNEHIRGLERRYMQKINRIRKCEIVETRTARGISEKDAEKIMDTEASGLEKHMKDGYVICLTDRGKQMSSQSLAEFLEEMEAGPHQYVTFIVGGFLGLAERVIRKADLGLSLSKMTFSHEMCRVMLLEQIYRALSINAGRKYAK